MSGRIRRRAGFLIAILAPLVAACAGGDGGDWAGTVTDSAGVQIVTNPAAGVWAADAVPAVTEELKIGTAGGDPNYQFGTIAAVDVGSDGSVYVLDQQSQHVRVFDREGTYLRTIGGPGSGPGELSQQPVGLVVTRGDTLFVPDVGHQRITRYTGAGQTVGSFPLPLTQGIPMRWQIGPDGRIVQQARVMAFPGQSAATAPPEPKDWLLERDPTGAITDTVMELPIGESFQFSQNSMRIRLFEAEPIWALGSGGAVYYGLNSGFDIGQYGADGELVRRIRKPAERKPVTEADIAAIKKAMEQLFADQGVPPQAMQMIMGNLEFADHYPAFANMIGGPGGSLWAQRVTSAQDMADAGVVEFNPQDIGSPVWDVFATDGRYMGAVRLPDRFQPLRVIDNHIWGVWRDELDVQYVTMLRVDIESTPVSTEGQADG
jgi:hypothetical protein